MHNNYSGNHWEPLRVNHSHWSQHKSWEFQGIWKNPTSVSVEATRISMRYLLINLFLYANVTCNHWTPANYRQNSLFWYCHSSDVHKPVHACIFTFAELPFHWFYRLKLVLYTCCLFPFPLLLRCISRHSRQRTNSRSHNAERCGFHRNNFHTPIYIPHQTPCVFRGHRC